MHLEANDVLTEAAHTSKSRADAGPRGAVSDNSSARKVRNVGALPAADWEAPGGKADKDAGRKQAKRPAVEKEEPSSSLTALLVCIFLCFLESLFTQTKKTWIT
jgi:hypothetical protein